MLNSNFQYNMDQLMKESEQPSIRYDNDKSSIVLCCFLLWAKKQNNPSNNELIIETINNLNLKKEFDFAKFETLYEYTVEDCIEAIKEIINLNSNNYEDVVFSGSVSLNELVIELLNLKSNDSFCDFGSGDGRFLSLVATDANNKKINCTYTGYEILIKQVLISKCLMKVLGLEAEIINRDYAREKIENQFDKAYLFPPFGLRYSIAEWESLKGEFGRLFTSRSETELLYLLKAFKNIKENGKLIVVLPQGVGFRSSGVAVREYLLENNFVEGIISLPAKVLTRISIPVDLWILTKETQKEKGVKMLDATNMIVESKSKFNVELDTKGILEAYYKNAKHVFLKEFKEHEYSLSIGIYETSKLMNKISNPVRISDVCSIEKGSQYTISKFKDQISNTPTEYQLLSSINIQDGIVEYDSLTYIKPDQKLLKFKLEEGDIVITTKSTVVKTFVANDLPDRNIIVTGGMIILRPNTTKVNPTYIKMFLDSSIGKNEFKSIIKGTTIGFIPFNDFRERMIISCPSLDKQNKLAEQYNNTLWTINALTKQLEDSKAKLGNIIEDSLSEGD